MGSKKLIIFLILILVLIFYKNNLLSFQHSTQIRPLGGFHGDFQRREDFAAGSNVIGSAGTSGQGAMSIGTGISIMNFREKDILPSKDIYVVPFSFSYGYNDNVDLSIAVPLIKTDVDGIGTQTGYADLMFSANMHYLGFYEYSTKSQLSIALIFPTGQDKITSTDNKTDIIISNYISKKLNNRTQFDFALSYIKPGEGDENSIITYGLSLSRGWSSNHSSSIEISGVNLKDTIADKKNYSLYLGNRFSIPNTNMSLSFVYGTSVYSTYLKQTINTSLSYSF